MKAEKIYFFQGHGDRTDRVLSGKRVQGGVRLREECDAYFGVILDNAQLEAFIQQLRDLAAQPEPVE